MDQQALLAKLQALNIEHENHVHAAVKTCEAQVGTLAVRCCSKAAMRATCRTSVGARRSQALSLFPAGCGSVQRGWSGHQESVSEGGACSGIAPDLPPPPTAACRRSRPPTLHQHAPPVCRLQDKKGRLYIVTALTETKVDLKGAPRGSRAGPTTMFPAPCARCCCRRPAEPQLHTLAFHLITN